MGKLNQIFFKMSFPPVSYFVYDSESHGLGDGSRLQALSIDFWVESIKRKQRKSTALKTLSHKQKGDEL